MRPDTHAPCRHSTRGKQPSLGWCWRTRVWTAAACALPTPAGWAAALQPMLRPQRPATVGPLWVLCAAQVPYSEHSSFSELRAFVDWFRPADIVPSVNSDGGGPKAQALVRLLRSDGVGGR